VVTQTRGPRTLTQYRYIYFYVVGDLPFYYFAIIAILNNVRVGIIRTISTFHKDASFLFLELPITGDHPKEQ
ncbi:MAG: hypothetical protein AAFN11_08080, partial [Chloroflexota bacterium]